VSFAGRTVLVTGAAKGIGRAVATHFVRAAAQVALVDRDGDALHATAAELGTPDRTLALIADVSDGEQVARAVTAAVQRFGSLDVVVNNAGIHFARAIDAYTEEDWDRLFAVNVKGSFNIIRAALPALRASRGAIVIVSSMTALVGQDQGAGYVASKGALVSMTKALAIELAPDGIRVNCVCPAGVDTPLMQAWAHTLPDPATVLRGQAEMHLLGRLASAEEIAAAIAFLASADASFITGVILPVEGGATLGYRRS
jgi:NAD(P)-dependent dehydrogenase (short-subunit alcohol dehydrogenase family)